MALTFEHCVWYQSYVLSGMGCTMLSRMGSSQAVMNLNDCKRNKQIIKKNVPVVITFNENRYNSSVGINGRQYYRKNTLATG